MDHTREYLARYQRRLAIWNNWNALFSTLSILGVLFYLSYVADVRGVEAPFSYDGERNENGVVVYEPSIPAYCIGDNVEFFINIEVREAAGHVAVKTKVVKQGNGGQVTAPINSERFLPFPIYYEGIPRSFNTAGISSGHYYIGTSARTTNTNSDMYIVPFSLFECAYDRNLLHKRNVGNNRPIAYSVGSYDTTAK